jgi:hypothetical protein
MRDEERMDGCDILPRDIELDRRKETEAHVADKR